METGAYEMCKIDFLDIPNMIEVSNAFRRLREAFYLEGKGKDSMAIAKQSLEWNKILQLILAGVRKVVALIAVHNTSTFIHCSDAWDRTAQLCSLAQLCLDPWFRTMEGFGVLVEKEWMRMGHKFRDRMDPDARKEESSPVFLQFLDCTYQLMAQYPAAFEFTEDFLVDLYDETVYGRYGNFYCNCDMERNALDLSKKTRSLWAKLLGDRDKYLNPLYMEDRWRAREAEGLCGSSLGGSGDGEAAAGLDEVFEVSSIRHSSRDGENERRYARVAKSWGVLFPKVESYNIVLWVSLYKKYI